MKFSLVLAGLLLVSGSISAQYTTFFPSEFIVKIQALPLLESPDVHARKLSTLPRGAIVQFVDAYKNGEYQTIDTFSGPVRWIKVRYRDKLGYVLEQNLSGTFQLLYEGNPAESLPPLNWYGVYIRDSTTDEIRKVELRLEETYDEVDRVRIKLVKTDQRDFCKFLVGTTQALPVGFAGPLGSYRVNDIRTIDGLLPGSQVSVYTGRPVTDTTSHSAWQLAATGCAYIKDEFLTVTDYQLFLIDYDPGSAKKQVLTPWIAPESANSRQDVSLVWYGDLDHDNRPDFILQDNPFENGFRTSLFLSGKAEKGHFVGKVCEYIWSETEDTR
jgi:hypothetical protein